MSFTLKRLWKQKPLLSQHERWRKQAEVLSLSKPARMRLEWFIYYQTKAQQNASKTARYFGISKKTFYKWLTVFDETNLRALEDGSRAPIHTRKHIIQPLQESRIVELRKAHPEFGKMKLQVLYQRIFHERLSSWQIQRIIEKYHLQRRPTGRNQKFRKQAFSKRKTKDLRKQERTGFLVAFDSIELQYNGTKRYIVTGIDTVSKVAWARMYSSHTSVTTKDLFQRLYAVIQGNILNICSDNGSEFEKYFQEQLATLTIPHYYSRAHTPKDNPVCERFNSTIKREFLRQGNWTSDIAEFNRRLSHWLLKYNCARPHQALNYLTPFEYHFNQGLVTDVSI